MKSKIYFIIELDSQWRYTTTYFTGTDMEACYQMLLDLRKAEPTWNYYMDSVHMGLLVEFTTEYSEQENS